MKRYNYLNFTKSFEFFFHQHLPKVRPHVFPVYGDGSCTNFLWHCEFSPFSFWWSLNLYFHHLGNATDKCVYEHWHISSIYIVVKESNLPKDHKPVQQFISHLPRQTQQSSSSIKVHDVSSVGFKTYNKKMKLV